MKRSTRCRTLCAAFVLMGVALLWLAVWPSPVQAHPCDDLYTRQQDRETCWWNYWNGLAYQPQSPTTLPVRQYTTKPHRLHPADPRIAPWDRVKYTTKPHRLPSKPVPPAPVHQIYLVVDERVCDIYYVDHADRVNCRWRLRNGLPLPALVTSGLILPVVPVPPVHQPSGPTQAPIPATAYQPVPVPQTTYSPPRGGGRYCTDFDSRAQYEHFFAGRAKPSGHDRDRDGLYCENL